MVEENELEFKADVRVISENIRNTAAISRPQHSWAAAEENKGNIYLICLDPLAELVIPPITKTSTRFCYFYQGDDLYLNSEKILSKHLVELKPDEQIHLEVGSSETRILWLEGEPIGTSVAMRGPFILHSNEEVDMAFKRYRETQFGENFAPVFSRDTPRFATYKGGEHKEFPEQF